MKLTRKMAVNGVASCKSIPEIISIKRDGQEMTEAEMRYWVEQVVGGGVADCQLGAWLMAVCIQGLSLKETSWLTRAMMDSGSVLSWPKDWDTKLVDKHSTGGVGDKVSLPLAPALAACGLKVPMISGRGLGMTGGTLDKLESIPGFRVQLSESEITGILEEVGCCIVGQTSDIVPADKIIYATRDVTGTVGNLGLITSSIISKKAAEGIKALVLDVKWGKGCYQAGRKQAELLAQALIQTSESLGVKTSAVISHMETPLGQAVGNSLEVLEALQCLNGGGPEDLANLVQIEGGMLLVSSGMEPNLQAGKQRIKHVLKNGEALKKFKQMIQMQGVSSSTAEELCHNNTGLPVANFTTPLIATQSGWVNTVDAGLIAKVACELGAGRSKPDSQLDLAAGVVISVSPGDHISSGSTWAVLHHSKEVPSHLMILAKSALQLVQDRPIVEDRITKIITS